MTILISRARGKKRQGLKNGDILAWVSLLAFIFWSSWGWSPSLLITQQHSWSSSVASYCDCSMKQCSWKFSIQATALCALYGQPLLTKQPLAFFQHFGISISFTIICSHKSDAKFRVKILLELILLPTIHPSVHPSRCTTKLCVHCKIMMMASNGDDDDNDYNPKGLEPC